MADDSTVEVQIRAQVDGLQSGAQAASKSLGDIKASAAQMQAALAATNNDLAKATQLIAAQASAASVAAPAMKTVAAAETEVASAATVMHGSVSTATREFRAAFDEISSGRIRMLPGTLAIIGQRVFGLGPAALGAVGGVAALTAAFGYMIVKAHEAAEAMRNALSGSALANNLVSQSGIQQATDRLEQLPHVSAKIAQQTVAEFASMRGMTNAVMLDLSDNIGLFAQATQKSLPQAAQAIRAFIEAPVQDGPKFLDLLGASAQQIAKFDEAAQKGNGAAMSAGLEILSARMADVDRKSGTLAAQMDKVREVSEIALSVGVGDGMDLAGSLNMADEAAKKLHDTVTSGRGRDLAAAMASAAQGAALLPPSFEAVRQSVDAVGTQSGLTKTKILEDQIAILQGSLKTAQASTAGAETAAQIKEMLAQKETELQAQLQMAKQKDLAQGLKDVRAAAQQETEIQRSNLDTQLELSRIGFQEQRDLLDQQVAAGKMSKVQELTALIDIARQESMAQKNALTEDEAAKDFETLNFIEDENKKKVITAQTNAEIAKLEAQLQEEIAALSKKGADSWKAANNEIYRAEDSLVQGIFSGRQSLVQSLERMGLEFLEKEIENDLHYLTQRILINDGVLSSDTATEQGGLLFHARVEDAKTITTQQAAAARAAAEQTSAAAGMSTQVAAGSASITNDAKQAAAGAYAAVAQIPVIGPFLAPGAAAVAYGSVMAFDTLTSLDVGTNVVPNDMVAMIHAGERVMPAADNSALMNALNGGGAGAGGPSYNFGDVIVQPPLGTTNPEAFGRTVAKAFMRQVRQGNTDLKTAFTPA